MPAPLDVDKEQVRMLVLSVGVREAARQMGIAEGTVQYWSMKGNWLEPTKDRLAELPKPLSQQGSTASTSAVQALCNSLADQSKLVRTKMAAAFVKGASKAEQMDGKDVIASSGKLHELVKASAVVFGWEGSSAPTVTVNLLVQ